jgi:hypothetical protein
MSRDLFLYAERASFLGKEVVGSTHQVKKARFTAGSNPLVDG